MFGVPRVRIMQPFSRSDKGAAGPWSRADRCALTRSGVEGGSGMDPVSGPRCAWCRWRTEPEAHHEGALIKLIAPTAAARKAPAVLRIGDQLMV